MGTLTADEAIRSFLSQVTEAVEIRDNEGNILGHFTPWSIAERKLYEKARLLFDPEEIKRRKETERGGHSLEQVMAHLRSLEASE